MTQCIIANTRAQALRIREALARRHARRGGVPYPIPGWLPDGRPAPAGQGITRPYVRVHALRDGTFALECDHKVIRRNVETLAVVQHELGSTERLGDDTNVTVPNVGTVQDLDLAALRRPPRKLPDGTTVDDGSVDDP